MIMKSSMYRNLAVVTCILGLLGLVAGCLVISVSFESKNPDIEPPLRVTDPTSIPSTSRENTNSPSALKRAIYASASNVRNITSNKIEKPITENPGGQSKNPGNLRMSNKTNQPVRLVILAQNLTINKESSKKNKYYLPAHWDFDPQEGSGKGLILSLQEANLKLEKGDVVVAFAQDGSRRYWGPYVVGETLLPKWNPQVQEWELMLTP
jgi:hypothetical protein